MRTWRWWLLAMAIVLWLGSMIADPYTTWGIEHEQVRPSVARLSAQFATVSLVLIAVAGLAAYWKKNSRWDGREMAFGFALLFFGGTALARLIWLFLYVLV